MLLSTVVERCLALAVFGLFVGSPALAQSGNVTAFNPYNGVGASSVGSGPAQPSFVAPPAVQAGDLPPVGGPAFNPWVQGGAPTPAPQAGYVQAPVYAPATYYNPGAGLPPPPPGSIESRLTAIPERAVPAASPVPMASAPPPTQPVTVTRNIETPPPTAAPAAVVVPPAPPPPAAAAPPPPTSPAAAAPPPPTSPVPAPSPSPAAPVASATPPPPEPVVPTSPPAAAAPLASIAFAPQSAEIAGNGRDDLDRIAKSSSGMKQLELRAYATGSDPGEARKIALARALSVRSYLIDQGVRIRIEVGAFSSGSAGAGSDRVDVLGP